MAVYGGISCGSCKALSVLVFDMEAGSRVRVPLREPKINHVDSIFVAIDPNTEIIRFEVPVEEIYGVQDIYSFQLESYFSAILPSNLPVRVWFLDQTFHLSTLADLLR